MEEDLVGACGAGYPVIHLAKAREDAKCWRLRRGS